MKLFQIVKRNWAYLLILLVVAAFFYKTFFLFQAPFPGDLLVGNHEPYKSQKYDGYAPGGVVHKAQGADVIHEIIPWKKFTIDSFKAGIIPFWDPYNFSGNPLLANFQSAVFFPVNLIFFILDFNAAWSIYIILIPILAAGFTYLFLRRVGVSDIASVFGGLAFAFSSYMTVWLEYGNIGYTFVFLPLILYFVDRFAKELNSKNYLGIVLSCFMCLLAGYIQGSFYIFATSAFYYLLKTESYKRFNIKKSLVFVSALIVPLFLSAFQLLPTVELFGNSSRGNYTLDQITNILNPWFYLITLIAPDFFGNPASRNYWLDRTYIESASYFGLIPLMLSIFAIFSSFKKIEVKIFTLLFFIPLILATDFFITRFFYLLPIPVLSTTVATRILSIAAFSGCVLAAFGVDNLTKRVDRRKFYICSIFLLLLLVSALGFTFFGPRIINSIPTESLSVAKRNLVIPLATIIAFMSLSCIYFIFEKNKIVKKFGKIFLIIILFVITFSDLFYYFHKITPFAPAKYMYPTTPVVTYLKKQGGIDRSWGYGVAYVDSNFQTYEKIFSTEGNDPLHIKSYTELISTSKNGRVPKVLPRPDAIIAQGFGRQELANNPWRQKILNITGVKYLLNKDESLIGSYNPDYTTFPEDRYKLIWQNGFWQVYENLFATPRIFITNKYRVVSDKNHQLRTILSDNFEEQKEIVLDEDPGIPSGNLKASVKLVSYNPNRVVISTSSNGKALLYLSDNYYPGWKAFVDGIPTKIYLTNYTFRSVAIPAGKHVISFEYIPEKFYHGIWIGLAGLIAVILTALYLNKSINRK